MKNPISENAQLVTPRSMKAILQWYFSVKYMITKGVMLVPMFIVDDSKDQILPICKLNNETKFNLYQTELPTEKISSGKSNDFGV